MTKNKNIKLFAIVLFILGSAQALFGATCTQPSGSSSRIGCGPRGTFREHCSTGSCKSGALYSNTSSSPNTLFVCVSSAWQAVK